MPRNDDRADLHERRQVVARREQQPHRQHRGDEAVDHHRPGEVGARPGERRPPRRALRHPLAAEQRQRAAARSRCRSPRRRLPGRSMLIHQPISSAIGIVHEIVNRPHGLSRSALTTTSASTASRMIMIAKIATMPATPATGFTSSFAIWPSDLPSRRIDAHRMTKSCTAPPSTTPTISQIVPGRKPNCAASVGPDQRAGAGDGREVVAEEHPLGRRHEVAAVVQPLGRRGAPRVEAEDRLRDEPRVEAVGDRDRCRRPRPPATPR